MACRSRKTKRVPAEVAYERGWTTVVQPLCRPPFNLRDEIEKKLDEFERMYIIEKVNSPSRWVSPVVVIAKPNGKARLCVAMRQVNYAVQREQYLISTIDEVL